MVKHDHLLKFKGVWEGVPEWLFVCDHAEDDPRFFIDNEGTKWDQCLAEGWWDNEGLDLVQATHVFMDEGNENRWKRGALKLWTSWDTFTDTPTFDGYHEHQRRMEESE